MLFQILLYGYMLFQMHLIHGILETFDVVFWRHFIWYFGYILHGYIHYFIDVLFYIDVHIIFISYVHVECMYVFNSQSINLIHI